MSAEATSGDLLQKGARQAPSDPAALFSRAHPRLNAMLGEAWRRKWLPRPVLESEALIAAARSRTGLQVPGEERGWRDRLDILTRDLHGEAELTPLGMVIAYGQLVAALANRARMHALWQRHPQIFDLPIRAPVIVLGQMRSGSTRMQRLLACDPRLAHTRFFESWNPVPAGKR